MSERVSRLVAVIRADFLVRLRRPSTLVVFLLLSACAYWWVPAPSTGRALIQIGNQRALYNSAAIGMATAMLGTIFIGLFGFYVISNAIKRDVLSRCGFVIASTTMRGSEYILGKFAGNVVFLGVFMAGFMVTSMAMLVVRAEAPLELWVFVKQYLLLVPPAIAFVSAISITFESVPLLRTRFGDVVYFFLWLTTLGLIASRIEDGVAWLRYFDYPGFGYAMLYLKQVTGTMSVSIGASNFDPKNGVYVFQGLGTSGGWLLPRIVATFTPLLLLFVARFFFHRFDPARLRLSAQKSGRTWLGRFNALSKPFARLFVQVTHVLLAIPTPFPLFNAARADAVTSIAALPLSVLAIAGFAVAALASGEQALFRRVFPLAFAALALVISDVASRERRAGTSAFVFAAPRLRTGFVAWKFASAMLVALLFLAVPLARAVALRPSSAAPLLVGLVFTCAAATVLGVVSANPKTFIVAFLTFWYLVTNDHGLSPELDFAGFYGTATPAVVATYAALAAAFLAVAHGFHLHDLRRRW